MAYSVTFLTFCTDNESMKVPEVPKTQISSKKRKQGGGKYGRKSSVGFFYSHIFVVPLWLSQLWGCLFPPRIVQVATDRKSP